MVGNRSTSYAAIHNMIAVTPSKCTDHKHESGHFGQLSSVIFAW